MYVIAKSIQAKANTMVLDKKLFFNGFHSFENICLLRNNLNVLAIWTTDAIGNSDHDLLEVLCSKNIIRNFIPVVKMFWLSGSAKTEKVDKMEEKRQRNSYLSFHVI
jgi:hypothetical protein